MLWVITLHIVALLFWCAALLYVPALVAAAARGEGDMAPVGGDAMPRVVYTHVATPAALLAIASGTLVFLLQRQADLWLISKLVLVTGLVITHVLAGLLVTWQEADTARRVRPWPGLLMLTQCALMAAILWVVLAKPLLQVFPWGH